MKPIEAPPDHLEPIDPYTYGMLESLWFPKKCQMPNPPFTQKRYHADLQEPFYEDEMQYNRGWIDYRESK